MNRKKQYFLLLLPVAFIATQAVPASAECPDFTAEGSQFTETEFNKYAEDPSVVKFPLSSDFICFSLKLMKGRLSEEGSCFDPPSQVTIPNGAVGPGLAFSTREVAKHKFRCESVLQVGLSPFE